MIVDKSHVCIYMYKWLHNMYTRELSKYVWNNIIATCVYNIKRDYYVYKEYLKVSVELPLLQQTK